MENGKCVIFKAKDGETAEELARFLIRMLKKIEPGENACPDESSDQEEKEMDQLLDWLHQSMQEKKPEAKDDELQEKPAADPIHHPDHYTWKGIECIEVIKIMTRGLDGFEGYLMGNIIKYLFRYPKKGTLEMDLMKAEQYTNFLRKYLTEGKTAGKEE